MDDIMESLVGNPIHVFGLMYRIVKLLPGVIETMNECRKELNKITRATILDKIFHIPIPTMPAKKRDTQEGYIEQLTRLAQCLNAKTGFDNF